MIMAAVSFNGLFIEYATEELKADKELAILFIAKSMEALPIYRTN